jgi:hypothetical protein
MKPRPHVRWLAVAATVVAGALAVPGVPVVASAATHGVASTTCATSRPHSGTILYAGISGGQGQLTIKNSPGEDGVVVLVRGRHKAIGVYVRAHARATVGNIQDGTYTIYYSIGSRFSVCQGRFTHDASYWRITNHLRFVTTAQTYTTYKVTLYVVNGGNAPTNQINPSDFPAP